MKLLSYVALFVLSVGASSALANQRTTENMWKTDYDNLVNSGLRALQNERYDKAFEKLTECAKLGSKECQFYLARMYLVGLGMEPDYQQGWLWLNVAMEQQTSEWNKAFKDIDGALPESFKTAMEPYVAEHFKLYGSEATDVRCERRSEIGSNIRNIICEKRFY